MMKQVKSRFTLIEMLAVVAIASILIALITPAVQNLMFGSRVDQYASNFKLAMEQAQAKAVASRKYIALILPLNHNNDDTPNQLKPYCKGGYRMAYVKKNGTSFDFDNWVEHSDWKNPNNGAMLVSVEESESSAQNAPSVPQNSNFNALVAVQNLPSGELGENCASCVSGHEAIVFSPYGGAVGHDQPLYFTFTEAKLEGSSYVLDNPDNFVVVKLNSITGRVTHFDPFAE